MSLFNKVFASVLFLFVMFGFVIPALISAKNNEAVILGFALIVVIGYTFGNYLGGKK